MSGMLAIGWDPEIRGILTVVMAAGILCGSVYMIMATNIGARLGFLVSLAGLAGWMFLMGIIWMIYGIGLRGPDPSWDAVPGRTVLQDAGALRQADVIDATAPLDSGEEFPADAGFPEQAAFIEQRFGEEGWVQLEEADPSFGQAGSEAGVLLEETGAFAAGEYQVVAVYDIGGERYPKIGDSIDFLAFFHKPHHVVVEVAPIEAVRTEPGRAPATPVIDDTRQHQYVYMVRNQGARRQPAAVLTFGGGLIFFILCWLLHRRDRIVRANLDATPVPVT